MLNLGIVAHVDAGKTSLTESLLAGAGVIDEIGSVDDGTTQTDSLALERQRGITIRSAVVSFQIGNVTVNLIDTPGHPDFIAEVERVLSVLDGAVLVISAVEGVQAQTRVLMRTLQRLRIPTLLFVNKIDRTGAQEESLLDTIADRLSPAIVPMVTTHDRGTKQAAVKPYVAPSRWAETLAEHDESLLAAYVNDGVVPERRLRQALREQSRSAMVHPVFFGSAITGAGIGEITEGIAELLPDAAGDAHDAVAASVFKVDRGDAGEKIAYVRMTSGTIRTRDRLTYGRDKEGKVTAIRVFAQGRRHQRGSVSAGEIGTLTGLADIQIGDTIGTEHTATSDHYFAPPTLETVVVPATSGDRGALRNALDQLAEQDPLINLRQDDELRVSLYGEVQKEVIQSTLATEYGLDVTFRETTTICIERPVGLGAAVERNGQAPNPFLATVGLRVEPAPIGSGVTFRLAIEVHGTMPPAFFTAVEDTVHETLTQGLCGWQVTDCLVTMTHTGYSPRQSHAHQGFDKSMSSTGADFRGLTPLVVMAALQEAGTTVYEPIHRFHLEAPADTIGQILPVLSKLQGVPDTPTTRGSTYVLEGEIPAASVHALQQQLPAMSRGEGMLESDFDSYRAVRGAPPSRPRTDHNPLNRKEYLLHVQRRV